MPLSHFHPVVARWFTETFGEPTAPQRKGWPAIREGRHTLIAAPTGSGKTLAAFLAALDDLFRESLVSPLPDEVRVVYVSPLKALSADIHRNLAEPRRGIRRLAEGAGLSAERITAAVRTGDTTQAERAAMLRNPPHILVTTPESLYLLLTAERSREMLRTVRTVILDEIHAVIGTRRGAHLALSLERLQHVTASPVVRIGLSATQKPIEQVARFLVGAAHDSHPGMACAIVDEGHRRAMDLSLELPRSALEAVMSHEVWEEYYERLAELIAAHRTTLVFVNTRRMAERVTRHLAERLGENTVTAHHGSLSKERRLEAERRLAAGDLKALVATASLELGIDIGHVDLVCQVGSPARIATLLQRVGRSGHTLSGLPKGRLLPTSRDDLIECAALLRAARQGELDAIVGLDAPLDVLAQQVVAETACRECGEDELFALVRRAWPYRDLSRRDFDAVTRMLAEGFGTRRGRRAALLHRDEVNGMLRGRRGARLLAIASGGAIPELADYRVVLDPEETVIGTLNEDFAIESMGGDVFQLGNASWRVLQVGAGVVRVADAKGAPPNIPFWLGEAPGRSDELSRTVSALRAVVDRRLVAAARTEASRGALEPEASDPRRPDEDAAPPPAAAIVDWFAAETGVPRAAAEQAVEYLGEAWRALGALPTQETLVIERFFDESGGMQLVLHAPFGSRINKAWGLALRKRFCRQFNFELQAAATEDALLLSLGPQHSFPLADVFRYLHPATARDVLVQAFLDAPVFQTRWRWNTTVALAVPRNRGGRKVAPQVQRMLADDLMAAVFPDAAACLENIPGDREIPDHPLVNQTVRDCLQEAMDFDGLSVLLRRIHADEVRCVARDLPEPSVLAHEILNARPYAFLDDAPLEERRAHAVYVRRASEGMAAGERGALDPDAIARVRGEARPAPRDADELHDALLTAGFLEDGDVAAIPASLFDRLIERRRAGRISLPGSGAGTASSDAGAIWAAAERLPEILAVHRDAVIAPALAAPASRASRVWSRDAAVVELVRGRLAVVGPTTAAALARSLAVRESDVDVALLALEAEGVVLRGAFTAPGSWSSVSSGRAGPGTERPAASGLEWCDRGLLARIHRYTLNRLRAEIEPVSPADFMRFLFTWQHVEPVSHASGIDGLRAVAAVLDGFEVAARAWERWVLPARMDRYEPAWLDMLCLTGEVGWARLTTSPAAALTGGTSVGVFLREHASAWAALRARALASRGDHPAGQGFSPALPQDIGTPEAGSPARRVLEALRGRGASFARDLSAACALDAAAVARSVATLAAAGLVTSDGFAGLRALLRVGRERPPDVRSDRASALPSDRRAAASCRAVTLAGRWSVLDVEPTDASYEAAVETCARVLLRRYGVVFRRLLARETNAPPWRELTRVYRRLEARGEIRGGRFVAGMSGEQFALPEAVERLREVRRSRREGRLLPITAADPLNLTGIVTTGERIPATPGRRLVYRDGVPLAVMEGDYVRALGDIPAEATDAVASVLAGRRVPAVVSGYVGR